MDTVGTLFLESALYRFQGAKELGDKALAQLSADDLAWTPSPESNSIAVIVQHLRGNMLSRWTDFLTSDGEKPWRDRDGEFVEPGSVEYGAVVSQWEEGWRCLLSAIEGLKPEDLSKIVVIRGQTMNALDAINRQIAHVSYHVGQMVYLARLRAGGHWKTLSIARGASTAYTPTKRD